MLIIGDLATNIKNKAIEGGGQYSEIVLIKPNGDFKKEVEGKLASLFAFLSENSLGMYELAKAISDKFPEINFQFETDKEGRWIKYAATVK